LKKGYKKKRDQKLVRAVRRKVGDDCLKGVSKLESNDGTNLRNNLGGGGKKKTIFRRRKTERIPIERTWPMVGKNDDG